MSRTKRYGCILAAMIIMSVPVSLVSLFLIRANRCTSKEFTGIANLNLIEPRSDGNHVFEDLVAIAECMTSANRDLEAQIHAYPDTLASWVASNEEALNAYQSWIGSSDQGWIFQNIHLLGTEDVLPEMLDLDGADWKNQHQIGRLGTLFFSKADLLHGLGDQESAEYWLNQGFAIIRFFYQESHLVGVGILERLLAKAMPLTRDIALVNGSPADFQTLLPTRLEMIAVYETSYWRALLEYQFMMREDPFWHLVFPEPGFFESAIFFDQNTFEKYLYQDFLRVQSNLVGQWVHWDYPLNNYPSSLGDYFVCYPLVPRVIREMDLDSYQTILDRVGMAMVLVARTEVEMRLLAAGKPVTRATVSQILAETQLKNPFTQEPFALDEHGDFLLSIGVDITVPAYKSFEASEYPNTGLHFTCMEEVDGFHWFQ